MKGLLLGIKTAIEFLAVLVLFVHFFPLLHFADFKKVEELTLEFWVFIVAASLIGIGGALYAIVRWKNEKLLRNQRFVSSVPNINIAYTRIHDVMAKRNPSKTEVIGAFIEFCNRLSEAFTKITGEDCQVCIKINQQDRNEFYTITLARDHRLALSQGMVSRSANDSKSKAVVTDNTDFSEITNNIRSSDSSKRFFFSNSLVKLQRRGKYKNSSFVKKDLGVTGPKRICRFSILTRLNETKLKPLIPKKWQPWPLPYKSAMVAAICPSIDNPNSDDPIAGFLCVDCKKENVFVLEDDIDLLAGCANGLYNAIQKLKQTF